MVFYCSQRMKKLFQKINSSIFTIWNYSNESQSIDEITLAPADVKIIAI